MAVTLKKIAEQEEGNKRFHLLKKPNGKLQTLKKLKSFVFPNYDKVLIIHSKYSKICEDDSNSINCWTNRSVAYGMLNDFKSSDLNLIYISVDVFTYYENYLSREFLEKENFSFVAIGYEAVLLCEKINVKNKYYLIDKNDINQLKNAEIENDLLFEINYELPEIYRYKFDPNVMFILDKVRDTKKFDLPFPDFSKTTSFDCTPFLEFICPGCVHDEKRCKNCGAALFVSDHKETCCKNNINIKDHLISGDPPKSFIDSIIQFSKICPNFARKVNQMARPVLEHSNIKNQRGAGSTISIKGIPYSVDTKFQFFNQVYITFHSLDNSVEARVSGISKVIRAEINILISSLLSFNKHLKDYIRNNSFFPSGKNNYIAFLKNYDDKGANCAIIGEEDLETEKNIDSALLKEKNKLGEYKKKYINPISSDYDQLLYPLIFFEGKGGCGKLPNETAWKIDLMKRACCCLLMQPSKHYINKLSYLREEYLCSVYGRIMQYRINYEYKRQMIKLSSQDIDSGKLYNGSEDLKEGIKTYIPKNIASSPKQWKELQNMAFLLSVALGPPTFFITITTNPHWPEIYSMNQNGYLSNSSLIMRVFRQKRLTFLNYIKNKKIFGCIKGFVWRDEFQQRGLPHAHILIWSDFDTDNPKNIDRVLTTRLPNDPFEENQANQKLLKQLIVKYEKHSHSQRCKKGNSDECIYNYPKPALKETRIINNRYEFARDEGKIESMIVPFNVELLCLIRSHIEIEPVVSNSCIGYVMKYCTKDSDSANIYLKEDSMYCGQKVSNNDLLRKYYSSHVVSGCEAFELINGYKKRGISPRIIMISIHLDGEKFIYTSIKATKEEIEKKRSLSSLLERYFLRPKESVFNNLTICEYYSLYSYSPLEKYSEWKDNGNPSMFISKRNEKVICYLREVNMNNIELFSLRLLLNKFPARSYKELYYYQGLHYESFREVAVVSGLLPNGNEYVSAISQAIEINRPPSDLRFLIAMYYKQGADLKYLIEHFLQYLSADLDCHTIEAVYEKMASLFIRCNINIPNFLEPWLSYESQTNAEEEFDLSKLTNDQKNIIFDIEKRIKDCSGNLMFIQGRAGTGKTFLTKTLIGYLENQNFKILISGTTGIAASQYNRGTTIHSLFSLGLDDNESSTVFHTNIGKKTYKGGMIKNSDLIIIDEISMLTVSVANKVDYTLRFLCSDDEENFLHLPPFGGKNVLFVGDLLQLPPVIAKSNVSVSQKLITKCNWWNKVKCYGLKENIRSSNKEWNEFLYKVGNNDVGDMRWKDLNDITITRSQKEAERFFLKNVNFLEDFPLDMQWICSTNYYTRIVNDNIHKLRMESLPSSYDLGESAALTVVDTEIDENEISKDLSYEQRYEFASNWKFPDLPDPIISFSKGEPMSIMRNLNTYEGIVKNKRCWVKSKSSFTVTVLFENGKEYTIPRMIFSTRTNGIKFVRSQIPLKPMYAGTVHKSQGMTLNKVVIDIRSPFWEHGQLYVALSRIKDPKNICILLPDEAVDDDDIIRPYSEKEIVDLVLQIEDCEDARVIQDFENTSLDNKNFITDSDEDTSLDNKNFITDSDEEEYNFYERISKTLKDCSDDDDEKDIHSK